MFFINNAIYGMTGGQMAPTTLLGMKTSTTPLGRRAENEGFPIRVCELLSALEAPYYLERVAVGEPRHNARTRRAIRKGIQYQIENKGFSLIEVLSPCPTGWKIDPVEAARWTIEEMVETFPLGTFRDGHGLKLGHPRRRPSFSPKEVAERAEVAPDGLDLALAEYGTPMEEARFKIAGFGGQGVVLLGTILAHAGMLARRQVSSIPSYGPEMRGGTAHCAVTISDNEIGSPLIQNPTVLVALNGPSLERFGEDVVSGGAIFYNSSMVRAAPSRSDVTPVGVPANLIAERLGNPKAANMVILGAMLARGCAVSKEAVLAALPGALKSPELVELNRRAIDAGMEFGAGLAAPHE